MKTSKTNPDYRPYNGHANWQLWNVSVWMSADEEFYYYVVSLIERYGTKIAADLLGDQLCGHSTPDGARYSKAAVRYAVSTLIE